MVEPNAGQIWRYTMGEAPEAPSVTKHKTTHRKPIKLRSELTQDEKQRFGAPNVVSLFRRFNSELNEIWEDYTSITFYMSTVHDGVKSGKIKAVSIPKLVHKPRVQPSSHNVVYGILNSIRTKTSGKHAFIDAVSLFEHYMSKLVLRVYMDFPHKLKGLNKDSGEEADARRKKLLDVILDSSNRDEMIEKLIEEKIRSLFYGNPSDLFDNDKANIGFKTHFKDNKDNQVSLVKKFQEITARRNIIMHNEGRVDRKYLSEAPGSVLKIGEVVGFDEAYLRQSLLVIKELAASAAQLVATNIYKMPLRGKVNKVQEAARKRPIA
jgi:hypothetical protein